MAILNYTTSVPAARTVGEVQKILVKAGADAVIVRYASQEPAGVSFTLPTAHGPRAFTLPVNIDGVRAVLREQYENREISDKRALDATHGTRVAWRIAKDWLAAQVALIEAGMATLDQIMLPYLHVDGDTTLYEVYQRREQAVLEAGGAR